MPPTMPILEAEGLGLGPWLGCWGPPYQYSSEAALSDPLHHSSSRKQ